MTTSTPQTEPSPITQLRKTMFGCSFILAAALFCTIAAQYAAGEEPLPKGPASADMQAPLPPGCVHMGGQVSVQMDNCMKNLITARDLDTLIKPFREKTDSHPTGFGHPDNWRADYWGKWFTALAWGYAHKPIAETRELMDRAVEELLATQGTDGNISSFAGEKRLNGGYDVWGRQCVILGLTAYYDMTGDKAALDAACRVLDCLIDEVKQKNVRISDLGWKMWRGLAPSVIVESGAILYQRTGRQKYRDFSEGVVAEWNVPGRLAPNGLRLVDDALAGKPARIVGSPKGYEQLYCFIGLCELFRATENRRYLDAAVALARNIRADELFITGTATTGEVWFKGQGKQTGIVRMPAETCVTAHWMYFCWHLLRLTDDPGYADELELSLYNSLLGALMPEGHWWGYFQSLMGERVPSYIQQPDTGLSCCVVSGSRALMLTPFWAVMQAKDGPVVNLYFPGSAEVRTASGSKTLIEMETDYPREGIIRLTVKPQQPETFTVALRIPAWSESTTLTVNGTPEPAKSGTYSRISRLWKVGDRVELRLDMRTRIQDAPDKNGQVALIRGPIVLALDERLVPPEKNALVSVDRDAVSVSHGKANLNPASAEKAGVWLAVDVPFLYDGKRRTLTMCDYSSAGNQWSSTNRFRTWLPQPLQLETVYNTGVTWKTLTHGNTRPQAPAIPAKRAGARAVSER